MSNTLAFLIGVILILIIIVLIVLLAKQSPGVANAYRPIACDGVIGN